MKLEGDMMVFVILGAALVAVGVHLILWSRRQSGSIKRFAESKGLVYHAHDPGRLEERVNDCVSLDEPDLDRTFGQLSDVVSLRNGSLFRAVELLDLAPWGRAEYVNRSRVAVFFPWSSSSGASGIFSLSPALNVHQRYPESPSHVDAVKTIVTGARIASPPCTLSLTVMRGQALAYLEPVVTGSVSRKHLDYLVNLADALAGV